MKFDSNWLIEHLEGAPDPDDLAERLTDCGCLVELREAGEGAEIWDVEVTTNRPDAMNHRGLAREAAVATRSTLKPLLIGLAEENEKSADLATVEIADTTVCTRFAARIVRDVKQVPSPEWLQNRLMNSGVRPINAVVDVTNCVLLELGQPLHAYDLDKVRGRKLVARRAEVGETLTTLDGVDRTLDPEMAVIADGEGVVGLAGIMGGASSEIGEDTIDILLEAAHFDALTVRRAARRLGMHTEASHRFERGADPEMPPIAVDLAAAMIAELAGGRVCRGRIDVHPSPAQARKMEMSLKALSAFAGLEIVPKRALEIFEGLGFLPQRTGDCLTVTVPSFRVDIERIPDLYEEVIRHVGYAEVPSKLPVLDCAPGRRNPNWELVDRVRFAAVSAGLTEIITWSFIDPELDELVGSQPICPGSPLPLDNPLARTQGTMRRSLLPGMVAAGTTNFNQGERRLAIFEQGRVFCLGDNGPIENERLAILLAGDDGNREVQFTRLKGMVDDLANLAGLPDLSWERGGAPWLDEDAGAVLKTDEGAVVGFAGMLATEISGRWGFRQEGAIAEIDLGLAQEPNLPAFEPLPRYPAVVVDMTVEHPGEMDFSTLLSVISEFTSEYVADVSLAVRFTGKGLPEGVVRTTFRLVYRHPDHSLTQDEVNAEQDILRENLARKLDIKFA